MHKSKQPHFVLCCGDSKITIELQARVTELALAEPGFGRAGLPGRLPRRHAEIFADGNRQARAPRQNFESALGEDQEDAGAKCARALQLPPPVRLKPARSGVSTRVMADSGELPYKNDFAKSYRELAMKVPIQCHPFDVISGGYRDASVPQPGPADRPGARVGGPGQAI